MTQARTVKPGEIVQDSGIYEAVAIMRATLVKGEPAPPTPGKGQVWRQAVDTNPED